MPILDILMNMIAEQTDTGEGTTFVTSLDMNYLYGQVDACENMAKHLSFQEATKLESTHSKLAFTD